MEAAMTETMEQYRARAKRECVRIVGDGWYVTMGRNPRNFQNGDAGHQWMVVAYESSRSQRAGERLAARVNRQHRSGAWSYRAKTLEVERALEDGRYVYDFPNGTRVSGAKLYPVLEWVIRTPDRHPDKSLPIRELDGVLRNGGIPTIM